MTRFWAEGTGTEPPVTYRRDPDHQGMVALRDVRVPMRDGGGLCADIFRPETRDPLPALIACSPYNKAIASPEYSAVVPPQPAWSPLWSGAAEAGDTDFLVARGYVHVIATARGNGGSTTGGNGAMDLYDLVEWIAAQDWCDGKVGMIGISAFGAAQLQAAQLSPPALKAIFPYDPGPAYRDFRDRFPGGVLHTFPMLIDAGSVGHATMGPPGALPPVDEARWQKAVTNPDYIAHHALYNILTMKGQKAPIFYRTLTCPYDPPGASERAEATFAKVRIPTYVGTGRYAHTYKSHFQGAQNWYANLNVPKKLMLSGPVHVDRPFRGFHHEILRWYDYWLKGLDTGIMDEPPVKVFVTGANRWLYGQTWPLPETTWAPFYLDSWERLRSEPFAPSSRDGNPAPDSFVQMPASQTRTVQKLRYVSEPLGKPLLVAGPIAVRLHAAIDQTDTNWMVTLKDIGPAPALRDAQDIEGSALAGTPETVVSRGWLKASHRATDPERSKPWKPWHYLTEEHQQPVVPGEIVEYAIEMLSTAHQFDAGHRLCLEISSMDFPTGVGGMTNVEFVPFHICSSKTVVHHVYRDALRPSHVLLPIVAQPSEEKP